MTFSKEEIDMIKSILQNADDELLCELFGDVFEVVKKKLREQKAEKKNKEPYQFYNRFKDIS